MCIDIKFTRRKSIFKISFVWEIVVLMNSKDMHIISKLAMCIIKTKNSEKYGFRGKFCWVSVWKIFFFVRNKDTIHPKFPGHFFLARFKYANIQTEIYVLSDLKLHKTTITNNFIWFFRIIHLIFLGIPAKQQHKFYLSFENRTPGETRENRYTHRAPNQKWKYTFQE